MNRKMLLHIFALLLAAALLLPAFAEDEAAFDLEAVLASDEIVTMPDAEAPEEFTEMLGGDEPLELPAEEDYEPFVVPPADEPEAEDSIEDQYAASWDYGLDEESNANGVTETGDSNGVLPTAISYTVTGPVTLTVGGSKQLSTTLTPSNASTTLKWMSSNNKVVSVSGTGKVTAVAAGKAKIQVMTANKKRATIEVVVQKPAKVLACDWYKGGSNKMKVGNYGYLLDIKSGIVVHIKRMGGISHADVEPASRTDTTKLKRLSGGSFNWNRHPGILYCKGKFIACSFNTTPHGRQTLKDNGFDGQFCLHMLNSKTHGSNKVDPDHQAAVKKAYRWAHSA